MEWRVFDNVKFEKEKAMAKFKFNGFRGNGIVTLRRFCELLLAVVGLISWSPAVLEFAGGFFVELSTYASNHHVVFLVGNAIIVLVFVLCRHNDVALSAVGGGDFYDDYVKFSEAAAAHQREPPLPPPSDMENTVDSGDGEKQIVVMAEEAEAHDDAAAAVEKATRQIERFQRTQSEKVNRESAGPPRPELRRSETESCRKTGLDVAEIETLSGEEFRRIVDSFIDKHWPGKRTTKQIQSAEHDNYHQLVKMA